jgi:hypothetical protein
MQRALKSVGWNTRHDLKVIADTSEPFALRSTAMLLKADLHERLGQYDSAITLYAQHTVDFDSTADMQYRSWRAAELTAYMTDTTRGVVYDSLMGALHERIFDDKFGPFAPALVKRGDNEPLQTSDDTPVALEIQPNPFENTTQLQWRLRENANVRIVVTDALGRVISEVFNGQCNTGVYSADIDGSRLPIGVYYCRLETMGTVVTRQIALIR